MTPDELREMGAAEAAFFNSTLRPTSYGYTQADRGAALAMRDELLALIKDYGFAIDAERRRGDEAEAALAKADNTLISEVDRLRLQALRDEEELRAKLAAAEALVEQLRLDVGAWLRGELSMVCGDCRWCVPSCDMEFGHFCKLGDESKVWDVEPWRICHFTPSRWTERGPT